MTPIYKLFDTKLIKCKCRDCGREFIKGDEGDNEKYCLRCERESQLDRDFECDDDRYEP